MRIWLIGGTSESKKIAEKSAVLNLPVVVTVVSPSARSLYPISSSLKIWIGQLDESTITDFLSDHRVRGILDASHPYAVEISRLALGVSERFNLPYLRFERDSIITDSDREKKSQWITTFADWDSFFSQFDFHRKRILLTLGYRFLPLFKSDHNQGNLFARILPSTPALETAFQAGFTPETIIAIRPPISYELEKAIWKKWQISTVITKASGTPGGENIKRQLAEELGVELILIARPPLVYPQQTNDLQEALSFCQFTLNN